MKWEKFDPDEPPKNGKYLVFCKAPNYDSEWVDLARFDDGKWHGFGCPVSHHKRVSKWAEIEWPREQ